MNNMQQLNLFTQELVQPQRASWPDTWMGFVELIAQRSYDPKTKVAAVIVAADNSRVLSMGYNGTPHGFPNKRESLEDGKSGFIHAEQNAFYKLSYNESCEKILYTLFSPCYNCAQGAIQCKMNRIVYKNTFRDTSGIELIKRTNIEIYTLEEANILAKNQLWDQNINVSERKWFLSTISKLDSK